MIRAATYRMTLEQGATFDETFRFKNEETGEPIDFRGYAARTQVRKTYDATDALISLDEGSGMTTGGATGLISYLMPPSQTLPLPPGEYVFTTEIYTYEEVDVQRVLQGPFIITPTAVKT